MPVCGVNGGVGVVKEQWRGEGSYFVNDEVDDCRSPDWPCAGLARLPKKFDWKMFWEKLPANYTQLHTATATMPVPSAEEITKRKESLRSRLYTLSC